MAISLDIFSDPICPWCMIGKARLDKAEAEHGVRVFERKWRVFMLDENMPPEGAEWLPHLAQKFGGVEQAKKVYGNIAEVAEQDGVELRLDRITRRPSTVDAHRLLKFVEPMGGQDAAAAALFELYFRQGVDISEQDALVQAGEAGGLEPAVARKLLEGDAEREAVLAEAQEARRIGVQGAPTFIIAAQHAASGALATEVWRKVIDDIFRTEGSA